MTYILETRNVGVRYGKFVVNRDINLRVLPNSIHALIGPNGAGKTTFFNALSGRIPVAEGHIEFEGKDITRSAMNHRAHVGIARSFQITNLFPHLTTYENLRIAAQGRFPRSAMNFWSGRERLRKASEVADRLIERLSLQRLADRAVGELPHGRQRILDVALSLASEPKLLLLDEPTSGMGVDDVPLMRDLILDLSQDHTIVYVEHNMHLVMSLSHKISVLFQGEILVEGTPDEIKSNDAVRRVYLGERSHANT